MKQFLFIILAFILLNLVTRAHSATGSSMKIEGSCTGTTANGREFSFAYYSDYDGCRLESESAIAFTPGSGSEGLFTGKRTFKHGKDLYTFPNHQLILQDSTGNTSGELIYSENNNEKQSLIVQCDVRDYEYVDC